MSNQVTYDRLIEDLRESYDSQAEERDGRTVTVWQIEERLRFLSLLQEEGKRTLLEIGAGTGVHSKFFQDNGLQVTSTDLSPRNVELCREKGLTAHVADFLDLRVPHRSFDAIYALNCLIHVPQGNLPKVLHAIREPLRLGGLFYLGAYGGMRREGVWADDHYRPKRYFSFLSDEQVQEVAASFFELVDFRQIPLDSEPDLHFQSLVLRRGTDAE